MSQETSPLKPVTTAPVDSIPATVGKNEPSTGNDQSSADLKEDTKKTNVKEEPTEQEAPELSKEQLKDTGNIFTDGILKRGEHHIG